MALIKCSECNHDVSTAAKACPNCGAKVKALTSKIIKVMAGLLVLFIAFNFIAIKLVTAPDKTSDNQASAQAPSCENDYKLCKTNEDLINNFDHMGRMIDAKVACKQSINNHVKYGSPDWAFHEFGSFKRGDDFPKTGIILLVDSSVKIQNMFGAKVNSTVLCEYNLNTKKVLTIVINNDDPIIISERPVPPASSEELRQPLLAPDPNKEAQPQDPVIQSFMEQEEELNDKCRGGSGDSPDTMVACEHRDRVLGQLASRGWCWGPFAAIGAEKHWIKCQDDPDQH